VKTTLSGSPPSRAFVSLSVTAPALSGEKRPDSSHETSTASSLRDEPRAVSPDFGGWSRISVAVFSVGGA
jgi:hypothetical protein